MRSTTAASTIELAYDRRGIGPPLVLLHGIGHSRRAWDPVVDLLAAHRTVVAVDLPGHGGSALPTPASPLGVQELADLLERFLEDLGLESPAVGGNSLGGAMALELLRRRSAASAVALAPIGFWSRPELHYAIISLRSARGLLRVLRPVLPWLVLPAPARAAMLAQYFAHPTRLGPADALRTMTDFADTPGVPAILPYSRHYRFEHGRELNGPVTVAWGTRDRLLVGRQPQRARALLPRARHVRLTGCGHVPMIDDPQAVATLLLEP
jgi:pimeloyl-ACP methyl ester carboxylesterase